MFYFVYKIEWSERVYQRLILISTNKKHKKELKLRGKTFPSFTERTASPNDNWHL